jgi:hypothetical protein
LIEQETSMDFILESEIMEHPALSHVRAEEQHVEISPASRNSVLMCAPDYFGVDYIINPWMENQIGKAALPRAREQWENFRRRLAAKTSLAFVAPKRGLPDMVFTANAGLAIGDRAVVSRFFAKERRAEERLFYDWFERNGFSIAPWPDDVAFEGAGDALLDQERRLIWCGYGWRSSEYAPNHLQKIFDWRTVGLRLIDPRFYHLVLSASVRRSVARADRRARASRKADRGRGEGRAVLRLQCRRGSRPRLYERLFRWASRATERRGFHANCHAAFRIHESRRRGKMLDSCSARRRLLTRITPPVSAPRLPPADCRRIAPWSAMRRVRAAYLAGPDQRLDWSHRHAV